MGRLAVVWAAVLLGATACGSTTSLRSAKPLRDVLVYAQPTRAGNIVGDDPPDSIWRARLDGSHAERLASGNLPAVSPDGRWVAFERGAALLVMPTAGGVTEQVYAFRGKNGGLLRPPIWAPNSRQLVFDGNDGIVLLDLLSRHVQALPYGAEDVAFSPDSQRFAYVVGDGTGDDLYVVRTRGGPPRRVTHDHKSFAPVWGKPGIAFIRLTPGARGDIWLADGKSGRIRQLTHKDSGAWPVAFSVSGKELLAANPAAHMGRLWGIDVATGTENPVTPWAGMLSPAGLSADGRTVLATVCSLGSPYGELETIPFVGGKPRVIVRGPCGASWNG